MYSSFYPGYLLIFYLSIFISVDYQLVHYFLYLFFCPFICLFVYLSVCSSICLATRVSIYLSRDVMQGKFFQKCTHLLYIKKSMKYSGHRKLLCEISKLSNLMLLTSSDTKRTLRHLFLFTNSAQRELVSICTQSIHDRN